MQDSHSCDPGSIPGQCKPFALWKVGMDRGNPQAQATHSFSPLLSFKLEKLGLLINVTALLV